MLCFNPKKFPGPGVSETEPVLFVEASSEAADDLGFLQGKLFGRSV